MSIYFPEEHLWYSYLYCITLISIPKLISLSPVCFPVRISTTHIPYAKTGSNTPTMTCEQRISILLFLFVNILWQIHGKTSPSGLHHIIPLWYTLKISKKIPGLGVYSRIRRKRGTQGTTTNLEQVAIINITYVLCNPTISVQYP